MLAQHGQRELLDTWSGCASRQRPGGSSSISTRRSRRSPHNRVCFPSKATASGRRRHRASARSVLGRASAPDRLDRVRGPRPDAADRRCAITRSSHAAVVGRTCCCSWHGRGCCDRVLAWLAQKWPAIEYRYFRYRLDALGIDIRAGVVWRRVDQRPAIARAAHRRRAGADRAALRAGDAVDLHRRDTQFAKVDLPGLPYARAVKIRDHLLPGREHGRRRWDLSGGCIRASFVFSMGAAPARRCSCPAPPSSSPRVRAGATGKCG